MPDDFTFVLVVDCERLADANGTNGLEHNQFRVGPEVVEWNYFAVWFERMREEIFKGKGNGREGLLEIFIRRVEYRYRLVPHCKEYLLEFVLSNSQKCLL